MNERDAYRARLAYMEEVRAKAKAIRDEYDDAIETRYHNAFMARVRANEESERARAMEHESQVDVLVREIRELVSPQAVSIVTESNSAHSEDMTTSEHSTTREEETTSEAHSCSDEVVTQIQAPAPAELVRDSSSRSIGAAAEVCTRLTPLIFTSMKDLLWVIHQGLR